jgi:hypothetical protein
MTNTMTQTFLFSLCSFSLALTACKGGDKAEPAAGAAKTASDPGAAPAAAAKLVYKPLGGIGLEAEVPDDANIEDTTATAHFASVSIYAQPTTFVSGAGDDTMEPQTFDAAKQEVQKDPNPFKKFTKQEQTADGWKLQFELESLIDKKPVYGYKVRFKVAGKPYTCGSNGDSQAEVDRIIKLCSSIRKHG